MAQAAASLPEDLRPAQLAVDGSGRVGPIAAIPQVLHEFGVDVTEVAVNVGIDHDLFDNLDNTIPFSLMGRLFRACVVRSGCPHFGLLVGARSTVSSMGIVSQLMQHAPDVGTALRNLVLYLQLHDRGAVPSLEVEDGTVLLGYSVYQKDVLATDQIYDAAIAIGANILRALCGPGFRPVAILLRRSASVDGEPYRQVFKAPVRFDADQSALVQGDVLPRSRSSPACASPMSRRVMRVHAITPRGHSMPPPAPTRSSRGTTSSPSASASGFPWRP